jgi:hypothetical protein
MDGRPLDQVAGCLLSGVFSRWPVANGAVIGPEEVIINGYDGDPLQYCAQFPTHSMTNVLVGPDNFLYVGLGDGAAYTLPDFGQLGNHVCNDREGFGGSFRSQDPNRLNGKILRVNPATLQYSSVAAGLRNPFRLGIFNNKLILSETGWYTGERCVPWPPRHCVPRCLHTSRMVLAENGVLARLRNTRMRPLVAWRCAARACSRASHPQTRSPALSSACCLDRAHADVQLRR